MLSVSLGFEEVEEVGEEDSSKRYYIKKWTPFFIRKTFDFLILNFLKFLIEYILYSYVFHIQRTSVNQLKKKNEI
jgi:hypothetical protein